MKELFDKETILEILDEVLNFFMNIVNRPLDFSYTN